MTLKLPLASWLLLAAAAPIAISAGVRPIDAPSQAAAAVPSDGDGDAEDRRRGAGVPRHARRQGTREGVVRVREQPADRLVQPADRHLQAQRAALRRPDAAEARCRHVPRGECAQPGRASQGQRHHERRRVPEERRRRPDGRAPGCTGRSCGRRTRDDGSRRHQRAEAAVEDRSSSGWTSTTSPCSAHRPIARRG